VIDSYSRRESYDVMAVLTYFASLNMCWAFAYGLDTIVAAKTVTHDVVVAEIGGNPAVGSMAIITGIATGNVIDILALGNGAVVASYAGAEHLQVINPGSGCEQHHIVAILTDIGGLHVGWIFADSLNTVMAAKAITHDVVMIEVGGNPAVGGMAVVTTVATGNVIDTFAFGNRTVMAA